MKGIKSLNLLIKEMKPVLDSKDYVFCTVKKIEGITPLLMFKEKEGITLVVEKKVADKYSLQYSGVWSLITLTIHSDLSAVGFLAKITNELAKEGISVNVVSAYYHDHLFVPKGLSQTALAVLKKLSILPHL